MGKEHLIFIGAPGSGKGTQASRLMMEQNYIHLSTGDLLRKEITKESILGKQVKAILESGSLVNDDLMIELIKSSCDLNKNACIFDGYPRNLEQAKTLDKEILQGKKYKAVFFEVKPDDLVERLVNRRVCSGCQRTYNLVSLPPMQEGICDTCQGRLYQREDDKEEVIRKRLDIFNEKIAGMLAFYKEKGLLERLDAFLGVNEVSAKLAEILT